jgi:small multidrug resistance family-3 protein
MDIALLRAAVLFFLAGLAEIGGGYLVWIWLRDGKPLGYGLLGGLILVAYGVIPTLQAFPHFGRVYAAYGAIFIVMSLAWGWGIDGKRPDWYDAIGGAICLVGAAIILYAPRGND